MAIRPLKQIDAPGDPDRPDDRRSITRELKRGTVELIVLYLLSSGEAYGYEIVTKLSELTGGELEVSDGTLYPVLYRLERAGWVAIRWDTRDRGVPRVAIRWDTRDRGVPRKYYRLTDAGRAELVQLTREWTAFADSMARLLRQKGTAS